MKPTIRDHELWTQCRYKAPDTEVLREPGRRDDPKHFVARVWHMGWGKHKEALRTRPATSVRKGRNLDTGGMQIHMVGGEDVRVTPDNGSAERVYMPTALAHFWATHRAMWATHINMVSPGNGH